MNEKCRSQINKLILIAVSFDLNEHTRMHAQTVTGHQHEMNKKL